MTRCCFAGHPDLLIWRHAIFFLWGYAKDSVFVLLCHGICLSCEDESSLPSQELIMRCGRYGQKWIIGWTSAASQKADTQSINEVCKTNLESFSFYRYAACYHPLRHSSVPIFL
jgi:hypothetical protein